ncbi:MAG: glycoside hydrolase family 57 protein [candidate division WOR-3 bacterium]
MKNIQVAILWHFHQPVYFEELDQPAALPWVRLHALKDYYDKLKILESYPEIKVTFNFTPSLLEQLIAYDQNQLTDRFLILAQKPAKDLSIEERIETLQNFFLANWKNMIEPYPHYYSLLLKRGKTICAEELTQIVKRFSDQDFTDLQVWFNLVWIGPSLRNGIQYLYEKGHNFTDQDKQTLFEHQKKILHSIIPAYRSAWDEGRIELTTSPFYHPILPLIADLKTARDSNPAVLMPDVEFAYPEDCHKQIAEGINLFEKCFGRKPEGLWPPEGAVSETICPIIRTVGIEWIATDEGILHRSLTPEIKRNYNLDQNSLIYHPYQFQGLKIFFRDRVLSDLIGFVYNTWPAPKASSDFIQHIRDIARRLPDDRQHIISIILDGENAWEAYPQDGHLFLNNLYQSLIDESIKTTTYSRFLKDTTPIELPHLFPGSWINVNFNTWVGHPQKNRAWEILGAIRKLLKEMNCSDEAILKKIFVLETSDWFWWFGTNAEMIVEECDRLFRYYARKIYQQIDQVPPAVLYTPIAISENILSRPIDLIRPIIDGRVTHFYEWRDAGRIELQKIGGTTHRFASLFTRIFYGFDEDNIYLRADVDPHDLTDLNFQIEITAPIKKIFNLSGETEIRYKAGQILEVAIPFAVLAPTPVTKIAITLRALQHDIEIDRAILPEFNCQPGTIELEEWSV